MQKMYINGWRDTWGGLFEMDPSALYTFGHIAENRGNGWLVDQHIKAF